jgi:hypothetical protein
VAWALLGVLGVLTVGQLYTRHLLLPQTGRLAPVIEAVNQLLIFAPILVVPLLRKQGLETLWLPTEQIWARLVVGLVLAALAILAFTLVRADSDSWPQVYQRVYDPRNFGLLVQVGCEDVAIAILAVRFQAAIGRGGTILLVAVLFAAAHAPAMLATGEPTASLARLVLDAGLGVAILAVVQRSADIWWFWCVHFAMDMMQFYAVAEEPA